MRFFWVELGEDLQLSNDRLQSRGVPFPLGSVIGQPSEDRRDSERERLGGSDPIRTHSPVVIERTVDARRPSACPFAR